MKKLRERRPIRRNIELLATVQETDTSGRKVSKGFGNIIELGSRALILETNRELAPGVPVTVNVVFPGQPRGDDPFAHLHCKVRKAHDDPKLNYDLAIVDMDARTRERLDIFLAQTGLGRAS